MKKFVAILFLTLSILACNLGQSTSLSATQTALSSTVAAISDHATQAAWTATPSSVPTADFTARIGATGADLFTGPNENYSKVANVSGDVTIVGQAYGCEWLKVVSNSNPSDIGWISAEEITYSVQCSDMVAADFPPLPPTATMTPLPTSTATETPYPTPTATKKPSSVVPPPVTCQVNSNIIIQNRSGSSFTLSLRGPGNFTFYLGADEYSTVNVCSGTYDYYVSGTCNGSPASGSGKISDGDQVYFVCQ